MPNVSFLSNRVRSPLLNQLAGYWTLNEFSGTRYDSSKNYNNLVDNNTVTSAVGKVNRAAEFVSANSEYLSVTSNASLQVGNIDFTACGWVKLTSKASTQGVVSKYLPTGDQRQWTLDYEVTQDRFRFIVSTDGTSGNTVNVVASSFGSPSTNTWCFFVVWHDASQDTISIQINNGTINSSSNTGGVFATGTGAFVIGGLANLVNFLNGSVDEVGFWKRVLTSAERTYLYNSGAGRTYPFL